MTGLVAIESRIDRAIVGALRGQDLSGFEIWHWLGSGEGVPGLLTEADLYPTLYRLEAEHLLAGDWYEGERTRRRYRLTAKALELSDERSWPPLAFRGTPGDEGEPGISRAPIEPARTARTHSPDPDSGAWFVPPKLEPVTSPPPSTSTLGAPTGSTLEPGRASNAPTAGGPDQPGHAAIGRYADALVATLDLPRTDLSEVRQEISDHLTDTADALRRGGKDPETATTEALDRLGPAQTLARKIEAAQHTIDRRNRAIRRGVLEFIGELALWLVLSAIPIAVVPGIGDLLISLGRVAGLHLTVVRSAEWTTNQVAITLCIGAFAMGRMSLGYLARISRHSDAAFRRRWALGGAAVMLAFVLVLPCYHDPLVVATLLAAPLAFIAGTFRPKHVHESSYTVPGLIVAGLVMLAVIFAPAGRLFAFDPNGIPGTPVAAGDSFSYVIINQHTDGSFDYSTTAAAAGDVTFELWPASTEGLYVVVERSATAPAIVATSAIDLTKLPPSNEWWVVAVQKSADGKRTAVAMVIQPGASPSPDTALGWLISHL